MDCLQKGQGETGRNHHKRALRADELRLRLIRSEVEALVSEKHGPDFLKQKQHKKELAEITKTLKPLKEQVQKLEARKAELLGF